MPGPRVVGEERRAVALSRERLAEHLALLVDRAQAERAVQRKTAQMQDLALHIDALGAAARIAHVVAQRLVDHHLDAHVVRLPRLELALMLAAEVGADLAVAVAAQELVRLQALLPFLRREVARRPLSILMAGWSVTRSRPPSSLRRYMSSGTLAMSREITFTHA
jgi:hypothetical protein